MLALQEGLIAGPANKDSFEYKLRPSNKSFSNLGDGEFQIFLVDIFGKSKLEKIIKEETFIILSIYNPTNDDMDVSL
jgi:hypothetical protein